MTDREKFIEHLKKASAIVDKWPKWKKHNFVARLGGE